MKIENSFSVRHLDFEKFGFPEVKVRAWSNAFGADEEGRYGYFSIETDPSECGERLRLYKVDVFRGESQSGVREELESMAGDWNKNLEENWRAELSRCLTEVIDYEKKELGKFEERKAALRKLEGVLLLYSTAPEKAEKEDIRK